MATCVCVSILALTSEDALRSRVELGPGVVNKIIQLITKSVESIAKVKWSRDRSVLELAFR